MSLTISQTLKEYRKIIVDYCGPELYRKALEEVSEPKRFYTPAHLLEKGMHLCFSCGHLNSIDGSYCKGCGKEKFLITEENKK